MSYLPPHYRGQRTRDRCTNCRDDTGDRIAALCSILRTLEQAYAGQPVNDCNCCRNTRGSRLAVYGAWNNTRDQHCKNIFCVVLQLLLKLLITHTSAAPARSRRLASERRVRALFVDGPACCHGDELMGPATSVPYPPGVALSASPPRPYFYRQHYSTATAVPFQTWPTVSLRLF
ncbi:hypothetical protein BU23DRAFT_291311 [Bimuria novae-zelandiae CBS 107.79]|uniref:Uncharacterized protein n=1 Tax=Bimuria novae-zelandiae CBS 107.79 TaxID=1447943 RepID=A0A6A5US02_9PLEO|nr:hypothetical protein BU23DRAFT_291311 [Bimuria novae-zelandiae CBS 107.79]